MARWPPGPELSIEDESSVNQGQKENLLKLRENGQSLRQLPQTFNVSKITIIGSLYKPDHLKSGEVTQHHKTNSHLV